MLEGDLREVVEGEVQGFDELFAEQRGGVRGEQVLGLRLHAEVLHRLRERGVQRV